MTLLLLFLSLAVVLLLLLGGLFTAVTRLRRYVYRLNPTVDWSQPAVRQAWQRHGRHVGRFLSTDRALSLDELVALCHAHDVQRSDPNAQTQPFYSLEYDLQMLAETGIVLVEVWSAFTPYGQ